MSKLATKSFSTLVEGLVVKERDQEKKIYQTLENICNNCKKKEQIKDECYKLLYSNTKNDSQKKSIEQQTPANNVHCSEMGGA